MKIPIRPPQAVTAAVLAFFFITTAQVSTQVPPPGVLVGPTLAASLRNAAAATRDQAAVVQSTAHQWARRSNSAHYRIENFQADFYTMRLQFLSLRERFRWMASLALELNRPHANNVLTELDAGLDIIEELLIFVDQQFRAGSLDRATLVRTCGALGDVMREWEYELKRSNLRLGVTG